MKFQGVLIRFDCTDNKQFDAIGRFWEFMSGFFPKEELKGLGLNWLDNSFDYIIGESEGKFDYNQRVISQTYPESKNVTVELPDKGWKTYSGMIEDIAQIYEAIYSDGALDYEIEEIDGQGNFIVSILRL